jgi:hypothetical protein
MTRIESGQYAGRMENLLRILLRGGVTNNTQAVIFYGVNCDRAGIEGVNVCKQMIHKQ